MRAVLERHGGTVEKYIGDAIMAVFGLPQLHEDDALRAVRAAAEMQEALGRIERELRGDYGVRLENRTGVNTGEVVAGDVERRPATGHRRHREHRRSARAERRRRRRSCSARSTYRLVRDAVEAEPVEPLELKGKAERVPAYRLISVGHQEEGVARRLDAPMVGREDELAALHRRPRSRDRRRTRCQVVTVVAPAGPASRDCSRSSWSIGSSRTRCADGVCPTARA